MPPVEAGRIGRRAGLAGMVGATQMVDQLLLVS
jgi:hypothetical protein